MKRPPDGDPRRAALKVLVPYAHLLATSYETAEHPVARELRRLADFMDAVATDGSPPQLAAFFGVTLLH
jgi:hypothetical protein